MANAAARNKAQAAVSKPKAAPAAAETPVAEVAKPVPQAPRVKPPSIRNTIITMLNDGKTTKEITDVIQAEFPGTAAALKPSKHISFYKSRMKQDAFAASEAAKAEKK